MSGRDSYDRKGYGAEGYGVKDTGQFTKIPLKKKKKKKNMSGEAVAKSPEMGDGSGIPVSKEQLAKEEAIDFNIRKKLGLASTMNPKKSKIK